MTFRPLGTRRLGTGVFLGLDQLHLLAPDGEPVVRDVVRHPGGVGVLALDERRVWLVSQYRVAVGRPILEIPAGRLDRARESPRVAAERELHEELGATSERWTSLGALLPSPGYTDEVIHLFAAEGIVPGERRPEGAEERDAEVVTIPIDEAFALLDAGEIEDAKTQIALMAWARRRT